MSLLSKLLIILGLTTAMLGSSVTAEEPILSKEKQDQLKAQCDANVAYACGSLGIYILENKEVPLQERGVGRGLIKKACDLNNPFYCTYGGTYFYEKEPKLAAEFFKKACDSGDVFSCFMLGWIYSEKNGDPKLAAEYFKKACDSGGISCYMLGTQYFKGQGVQQDLTLASAYWKKGCEYLAEGCSLGYMQSCDVLNKLSDWLMLAIPSHEN